ncbi:MAG: response regulator [Verrucomicrobia bacterium]|nr:response regulator [Verrucomicrobiota bacterium]
MSQPKILSVDDSRMIHTLINKAFAAHDVQMVFASNGAEGLEVAEREKPDVILLDVTMPVMDGIECLTKLKATPSLKDIPVIMLTAEAGKENVLKIAKMGVRDYIVKPFVEGAVIDRVSRIVTLKPKSGAPAPAAAPAAPVANKKPRVVTDAIKILVVDEHPAIIESIQKAVAKHGWKVVGAASPDAAKGHFAANIAAEETPDIVLISLAFPNKAGLKFLPIAHAHPALTHIPFLGLCVKTATFEQNDAKDSGFAGCITKPLDAAEIPDRIARAMELDNTPFYYSAEGDVQVVTIPHDLSEVGSIELSRHSRGKIADFVNAGYGKLLLDLSDVMKVEIPIIRAVASIVHECDKIGIKWRIVGSDTGNLLHFPTILETNKKVATLKDLPNPFKGKNQLNLHPSLDAAIGSF